MNESAPNHLEKNRRRRGGKWAEKAPQTPKSFSNTFVEPDTLENDVEEEQRDSLFIHDLSAEDIVEIISSQVDGLVEGDSSEHERVIKAFNKIFVGTLEFDTQEGKYLHTDAEEKNFDLYTSREIFEIFVDIYDQKIESIEQKKAEEKENQIETLKASTPQEETKKPGEPVAEIPKNVVEIKPIQKTTEYVEVVVPRRKSVGAAHVDDFEDRKNGGENANTSSERKERNPVKNKFSDKFSRIDTSLYNEIRDSLNEIKRGSHFGLIKAALKKMYGTGDEVSESGEKGDKVFLVTYIGRGKDKHTARIPLSLFVSGFRTFDREMLAKKDSDSNKEVPSVDTSSEVNVDNDIFMEQNLEKSNDGSEKKEPPYSKTRISSKVAEAHIEGVDPRVLLNEEIDHNVIARFDAEKPERDAAKAEKKRLKEVERRAKKFVGPPRPEGFQNGPDPEKISKEVVLPEPRFFETRFETEFGITQEDLERIDGFGRLSEGQQKLMYENFVQITLGSVREDAARLNIEAVEERKAEMKARLGRVLGNAVSGIREAFTSTTYSTLSQEKIQAEEMRSGGIDTHREILMELIAGLATYGPRVHENIDGELIVDLVNIRDRAKGKENRDAEWFAMNELNSVAHDLAKLPGEWGEETLGVDTETDSRFGRFIRETIFRSTERKNREEKRTVYETARVRFETSKATLEDVMRKSGKSDLQIAEILIELDSRVHQLQTLQTNPDAIKALESIEDKNIYLEVTKSVVGSTRAGYFALGFASRTLLGMAGGFIGAPLVSAGIAGMRSWDRTAAELRERDRNAKKGVGDSNEGALNIVSADHLIERTERLISQYKNVSSTEERSKILSSLYARAEYIRDKQKLSRISYGPRRGSVTIQTRLTELLGETLAILASEEEEALNVNTRTRHEKINTRLKSQLDATEERITEARRQFRTFDRTRSMEKAAAFSLAGALVADLYNGNDGETVPVTPGVRNEVPSPDASPADVVPDGIVPDTTIAQDETVENLVESEIGSVSQDTNVETFSQDADGAPDELVPEVVNVDSVNQEVESITSSTNNVSESTSGTVPPLPHEYTPMSQSVEPVSVTDETASPEESAPKVATEYLIQKGDTLTGILKDQMSDIQNLSTEHAKDNAIANILSSLTPEQLSDIGIRSGNVDLIYADEKINLTALQEIIDEKQEYIERAANRFGGYVEAPTDDVPGVASEGGTDNTPRTTSKELSSETNALEKMKSESLLTDGNKKIWQLQSEIQTLQEEINTLENGPEKVLTTKALDQKLVAAALVAGDIEVKDWKSFENVQMSQLNNAAYMETLDKGSLETAKKLRNVQEAFNNSGLKIPVNTNETIAAFFTRLIHNQLITSDGNVDGAKLVKVLKVTKPGQFV